MQARSINLYSYINRQNFNMKERILNFIIERCNDNKVAVDNRFCACTDIYIFQERMGLEKNQLEEILRELHKEEKIKFGRLLNGFYIKNK